MNHKMTAIEEQALDALLSELHGTTGPRDLSDQILAQLRELPAPSQSPSDIVCAADSSIRRNAVRPAPIGKPLTIAISLVAMLAASLLFAFLIRQQAIDEDAISLANNAQSTPPGRSLVHQPLPIKQFDSANRDSIASQAGSRRPQNSGIPLIVETPGPGESKASEPVVLVPKNPSSAIAVTLVSAGVKSDLQNYWGAIGIKPADEASGQETSRRLAAILGVGLSPETIGDPEAIQSQLNRPKNARAIAQRWLEQITQGGLARLEKEPQQQLIAEVAESFRSRKSLDRSLASWISGESSNMSPFYTAVSVGGRHQMTRRLASLTMNVDLRCVQCHDALIEGSGRQEDYWSFAAFLRQGLNRENGTWTIASETPRAEPLFYSLPDGRQKVAEPSIASRWMSREEPITSIGEWSSELIGSPELARGVVNSLWTLVYGQPLRGRVVDTITAPHNESLDRLEDRLANDLVQSRFDVGRTLALIIASPATNRAVPSALLPENALVSGSEIQAAMQSVNAFAAALPPRNRLPLQRRIDLAMQRIGAKIDGVTENSILAQGTGEASQGAEKPIKNRPVAGADFPWQASTLPVQWLSAIKDEQSQVQHLGYLAGMSDVPESVVEAAKAIRAADVGGDTSDGDKLSLQRVWWLVRP